MLPLVAQLAALFIMRMCSSIHFELAGVECWSKDSFLLVAIQVYYLTE